MQQIEPHAMQAYEQVIMEMFYDSEFYEKESSNEVLREQLQPVTPERLKELKGIQFIISKYILDKQVFWIEKRDRKSPNYYEVVSVYYVVDFCIY